MYYNAYLGFNTPSKLQQQQQQEKLQQQQTKLIREKIPSEKFRLNWFPNTIP